MNLFELERSRRVARSGMTLGKDVSPLNADRV
ncbi:hypothetical protein HCH_00004 [Hahella chejuensis KCTC 2396]|uniref:Uncharacterized protein n=1 Tax=Hahella chejuensis (strain KCTC 2396) TaxID=349521 RepID=Q2SQZ7_HAHCH|nr:hypothetical protein HCH_00004 [Hahella chejuensis KCTC 2396]